MASERKLSANRTNARASTGPRSAPGKSRVSRNALRHGLAVPIGCDAKVSAEIEALAKSIVGPRASPDLLPLALRIAEAQLDLVRIRRVRHDLFSKALSDPDYESSASTRLKMKLVVALARKQGATTPMPSWAEGIVMRKPSGPEKFAVILSDMARKLAAIERYERRAISRRNSAIRTFEFGTSSGCKGRDPSVDQTELAEQSQIVKQFQSGEKCCLACFGRVLPPSPP